MTFGVQVKVFNPHLKVYEWKWVHKSGARLGDFYQYPTAEKADLMRRMCYPEATQEWVKVKEVIDNT